MLKGYRTYLLAILAGLVTAAHSLGYIDNGVYQALLGFLGAGSIATLRAALPAGK